MKRIILLLTIVFLFTGAATAQLLGDGSTGNPYRGTLTGNFTISGTKYFSGNIIADNEKLTLAAGTKLISVNNKAGIIISGTGQLDALGTSSNTILITSDLDLDGIYGEPTEIWGNITITSSNTSVIDYCIIEKGQKTDPKIGSYGGGLYLGASGITVTNTIVRNCLASRGGGILVAGSSSPVISRCTLTGNTANEQGGAIYIAGGSSPQISNVIFNNNISLSSTLKGGSIASIGSSPKIVNSTIAYSNSPASDGKSVYLENSPDARIINTIIWGGSAHVGLSGTPSTVFNYCAIEGISYPGCLNLNSSNTATDGPNFVNPAGGNFNINLISPCRDSGANSYAGVTIPATDYPGNARVWTTDIGAYEKIYSRWLGGSSDWSRTINWDKGFIPGSRDIIIPSGKANYPTLAPGPVFTLNSGLRMIMEPGSRVTFSSLTNNGFIELQSNPSGIASLLITNSYNGSSGSANVNLFITGGMSGPDQYRWHDIAPPATSPKSVFTSINPYNLFCYDESKVTTAIEQGWQAHDGYGGTTGFETLDARKGYEVLHNVDATIVFDGLTSLTTSMGQINLPFSGSGLDTTLFGYSLVGNSLTCGINWDLVTRSNPTYVRNATYIRTDYLVVSYVNGVGTNGGTAHIPPLQAFFVKTTATGTYITIPDNAREHNSTARFKSGIVIPLIRLEVSSGADKDETVIRFDGQATMDFDNEFDAAKMFGPKNIIPEIYSALNGENYSINCIPWPKSLTTIPLTLKIPVVGTYKIRRTELQGLGSSKVFLNDSQTGSTIDLSAISEYSFNTNNGVISGRFSLTIYAGTTDIKDQTSVNKSLKVYASSGKVCVQPAGSEWDGVPGKVRIFDMTGRVILTGSDEWFTSGEIKEYYPDNVSGMLIVEVTANGKRYLEKVMVAR